MAKQIHTVIRTHVVQDAGSRDANGVDTTTCFGIPGSGLPRRHCNVDIWVNVAVCTDLSVYAAINDGHIYQRVFGKTYACRLYACPYPFRIYIPNGSRGWDDVQFFNQSDKRCDDDVAGIVTNGTLSKTYEIEYLFDWKFGPTQTLVEGQEYDENYIVAGKVTRVSQNGGESVSDSHYVPMGKLTDYGWVEEMQESEDGHMYLCGGICYPNAVVDSDINAQSVEIRIPGMNTLFWYYPGDVRIKGQRLSCNRPEGHFYIKKSVNNHKFMQMHNGWRDCKNCPKDGYDHTVLRLEEEWIKAEITGKE